MILDLVDLSGTILLLKGQLGGLTVGDKPNSAQFIISNMVFRVFQHIHFNHAFGVI